VHPRLVTLTVTFALACGCRGAPPTLPPLSDDAFWRLSVSASEPGGVFEHADNLVSNESLYAEFARLIRRRGGAYIGVGPEQNFSYIARLEPAVAFVIDIRPDNRNLHLMYKALFEVSADRAGFLSRLFSRPRPLALSSNASVDDLFSALERERPSHELFEDTKRLIREQLMRTRRFPLTSADTNVMDAALHAFFTDGPDIRYGRSLPPSRMRPSYRTLMTITDMWGNHHSYLASEQAFGIVKGLHTRNLIIPIVGDFAGPHAIRRVGDYIRANGLVVSAFYASNVEVYLTRTERRTFCASMETLPYDEGTHFIGNRRLVTVPEKLQACAAIQPSLIVPDGFGVSPP
jgi:hypothetical protein